MMGGMEGFCLFFIFFNLTVVVGEATLLRLTTSDTARGYV